MYVKMIDQSGPSRIYQAGGETVEHGTVHWPDSNPNDATLEVLVAKIGKAADVYDRTLIYSEPFGYQDGDMARPFWRIHWARFQQVDADAIRMVMCTGPLYVLGDNGKTIDRA